MLTARMAAISEYERSVEKLMYELSVCAATTSCRFPTRLQRPVRIPRTAWMWYNGNVTRMRSLLSFPLSLSLSFSLPSLPVFLSPCNNELQVPPDQSPGLKPCQGSSTTW